MKYCISFIMLLFTMHCFAQATGKRPCPRFIVDKGIGQSYVNNFDKFYPDFHTYADPSPIFIRKRNFLRMLRLLVLDEDGNIDYNINGLRIILAQDGKKLRLIFTGLRDSTDTYEYFITNDNGAVNRINDTDKLKTLVTNYKTQTLPYTNGVKSNNTTSYIFNLGLNFDITSEVTRQMKNGPIEKVKFIIGAYDPVIPVIGKNIMLGFTFVQNDGSEIFLQGLDNEFGCEMIQKNNFLKAVELYKNFLESKGVKIDNSILLKDKNAVTKEDLLWATYQAINGDTGTPCPPGKNCGTSSL